LTGVAGSIAAVVALVLAGGTVERSFALPAPEELVANTVVRVSDVPGERGTITRAEFRHALVLVAVAADRKSVPKAGESGYEQLERAAVNSLLEAVWLQGLAAEMGISVTDREVSRRMVQIKRESFESLAEYRQFLKESRYTPRDVNERAELQLLGMRIRKRLERRIEREARNEYEEQQALRKFVKEFAEKWRARTVCAPQYATSHCSNGPPLP
jgi:hypothetical protein